MTFSQRTIDILKDAGWYPERKVDISSTINFLEKKDLKYLILLKRHLNISED